ncbi:unnamed protein product [Caenorhabditis angaria]|uniref:Uncharacterized protein n=1 Tax=Caenorhabditis angaria TaxID=860376 RepID=A0A9P1I459_9PELO|nr:unnamed protein product [Caenorhabditis angaria]
MSYTFWLKLLLLAYFIRIVRTSDSEIILKCDRPQKTPAQILDVIMANYTRSLPSRTPVPVQVEVLSTSKWLAPKRENKFKNPFSRGYRTHKHAPLFAARYRYL